MIRRGDRLNMHTVLYGLCLHIVDVFTCHHSRYLDPDVFVAKDYRWRHVFLSPVEVVGPSVASVCCWGYSRLLGIRCRRCGLAAPFPGGLFKATIRSSEMPISSHVSREGFSVAHRVPARSAVVSFLMAFPISASYLWGGIDCRKTFRCTTTTSMIQSW